MLATHSDIGFRVVLNESNLNERTSIGLVDARIRPQIQAHSVLVFLILELRSPCSASLSASTRAGRLQHLLLSVFIIKNQREFSASLCNKIPTAKVDIDKMVQQILLHIFIVITKRATCCYNANAIPQLRSRQRKRSSDSLTMWLLHQIMMFDVNDIENPAHR